MPDSKTTSVPEEDTSEVLEIVGPKKVGPQAFRMIRNGDETGVSGIGSVAEGCVFSNGFCAVTWQSATPCVQVWPSFEAFKAIHIDPHPTNRTELIWLPRGEP
jgi:hypothetical protein